MKNILHVYPTDDVIEHEVDGAPCICCPTNQYETSEGVVIVHERLGRNVFLDGISYIQQLLTPLVCGIWR